MQVGKARNITEIGLSQPLSVTELLMADNGWISTSHLSCFMMLSRAMPEKQHTAEFPFAQGGH